MRCARTGRDLTPDSAALGIVREQMPLHASQKRISWSYDPVTRMTDMSARGAEDGVDLEWTVGMIVETRTRGGGAVAEALKALGEGRLRNIGARVRTTAALSTALGWWPATRRAQSPAAYAQQPSAAITSPQQPPATSVGPSTRLQALDGCDAAGYASRRAGVSGRHTLPCLVGLVRLSPAPLACPACWILAGTLSAHLGFLVIFPH